MNLNIICSHKQKSKAPTLIHLNWYTLLLAALLTLSVSSVYSEAQPAHLKLWYNEPAEDWMTEALPIGNGYMGAMFFGGVDEERIQFTEESLWAGGPGSHPDYNFGLREHAHKYLPEVRRLLNEGKPEAAHALAARELTGIIHPKENSTLDFGDYGAQLTMGDLYIGIEHQGEITDYHRELDLQQSIGQVSYREGDVIHRRIYFGSYPRRTLVYRFENSASGGRTYRIRFDIPHVRLEERLKNNVYVLKGEVADNGMPFEIQLGIRTDAEGVRFYEGKLIIDGARTLTLLHTASTGYQNEFPRYSGRDYEAVNDRTAEGWSGVTWREMSNEHIEDYRELFSRVSLRLDGPDRAEIPTDARLQRYVQGDLDLGLEVLFFQYGRYLMISGSRPGTLPLTLQGKWNHSMNPPWANDYHMNINQQMLYWPAEVTGLPESHEPLFGYIKELVQPGELAAREFFGARGWVVNTMNNAFGYTSPGWGLPWGFFPGGAGWLSRHLWEHYAFNGDEQFLRDTAYPVMKKAALFWMDYLTEDENGFLVSMPSYSPEHGGISAGASMDHQIAWDILNNTAAAAELLDTDEGFREEVTNIRDRIYPPQIGRWGQLQEWKEDVDDSTNHHRHVSHLYALYPGSQISPVQTPELARAAFTSLTARGDGGTGWSLAWKINFWARLKDGDRAYKIFRHLLRPAGFEIQNMQYASGSYSNLLSAHPPFQLDGNMGGVAGIAEMLLQSHTDIIDLLPALPTAWAQGSVKGLRARGGCTIDIIWAGGTLEKAGIQAQKAGSYSISYRGKSITVELDAGERRTIIPQQFN